MREQVLDMCELSRKESLAVLRELVDELVTEWRQNL